MASVPSALPASTTITSSAQAALSIAAEMWADSLSVMIVTETRGTPTSYVVVGETPSAGAFGADGGHGRTRSRGGTEPHGRDMLVAALDRCAGPTGCPPADS